jgi:hypothetical protein
MKGEVIMVVTTVLANVDGQRLQKAVEGVVNSAYHITVISQSAEEISGFVANGGGKEYAVTLHDGRTFCSCRDAMYRKGICKHAVALALYTIRNPQEAEAELQQNPPTYNLTLGKAKAEWSSRCAV